MRRLDGTYEGDVPGPVLSARQESIKAQLREMIGEGPAAFFSDACLILSLDPRPATASHIVAHLLREIESAVRSVLQPPSIPKGPKGEDRHQTKIRAVLDELGVSAEEPTAQFWLGLAGEGTRVAWRGVRTGRPWMRRGQPTRMGPGAGDVPGGPVRAGPARSGLQRFHNMVGDDLLGHRVLLGVGIDHPDRLIQRRAAANHAWPGHIDDRGIDAEGERGQAK